MEKFWFALSVASSIATLILFFKEGATAHSLRSRAIRGAIHGLLVFFVVFGAIQWQRNTRLNDIREHGRPPLFGPADVRAVWV